VKQRRWRLSGDDDERSGTRDWSPSSCCGDGVIEVHEYVVGLVQSKEEYKAKYIKQHKQETIHECTRNGQRQHKLSLFFLLLKCEYMVMKCDIHGEVGRQRKEKRVVTWRRCAN
jgi:hypothetical protein